MSPLKYVLSFTFTVFFTISLLAIQNPESALEIDEQIVTEEISKVSAAEAISLFNFFKVETIKPNETTEPKTSIRISESKLKDFFDYFVLLSNPIP